MREVQVTRAVAVVLRVFTDDVRAQRHGYELMRLTGFPSGKIYPILARLLAAGWLEAEIEDIDPISEGRPPRRLLRLSERGVVAARRELALLYQETAPRWLGGPGRLQPEGGHA